MENLITCVCVCVCVCSSFSKLLINCLVLNGQQNCTTFSGPRLVELTGRKRGVNHEVKVGGVGGVGGVGREGGRHHCGRFQTTGELRWRS